MTIAYAMGQGGGLGAEGGAGFLSTPLLPIILMLAIMWFLLIRPQQKKQKEHANMVAKLDKNDEVITVGGVHATVVSVGEKIGRNRPMLRMSVQS